MQSKEKQSQYPIGLLEIILVTVTLFCFIVTVGVLVTPLLNLD